MDENIGFKWDLTAIENDKTNPETKENKSAEELRYEDMYQKPADAIPNTFVDRYKKQHEMDGKEFKSSPDEIVIRIQLCTANYSKKLLTSKLKYFQSRLSKIWDNCAETESICFEDVLFGLTDFDLLLSHINDKGEFNIDVNLHPQRLFSLAVCADFFTVLTKQTLQFYYTNCRHIITNDELRKWSSSNIPTLSAFAVEQLKKRQNKTLTLIETKLQLICSFDYHDLNAYNNNWNEEICYPQSCLFDIRLNVSIKKFQSILQALSQLVICAHVDEDFEKRLSEIFGLLIGWIKMLVDCRCEQSRNYCCSLGVTLLVKLLSFQEHATHLRLYKECLLLLMTSYQNAVEWNDELVNKWMGIVMFEMKEGFGAMYKFVITTWNIIIRNPESVKRLFDVVSNQQGHVLAFHILQTNLDESDSITNELKILFDEFCSKYCF